VRGRGGVCPCGGCQDHAGEDPVGAHAGGPLCAGADPVAVARRGHRSSAGAHPGQVQARQGIPAYLPARPGWVMRRVARPGGAADLRLVRGSPRLAAAPGSSRIPGGGGCGR